MNDLTVGKVYMCSDGMIRRLDKVEEELLHYSVPTGDKDSWRWMKLSGTYRSQIESDFVNGDIVEDYKP